MELHFPKEWELVGYSEWDKYAAMVHKYHTPNVTNYGDISTIEWERVPDFDLLTGGSPCQDFSIAGKRAGLAGTKSSLAWEYIRILKEKKPSYFIWENVKGTLSSRNGWDFANLISAFSEEGYALWWQVLNAKDFGVPQNRERIFVVGTREGSPKEVFFEPSADGKNLEQLVGGSQGKRVYGTDGIGQTQSSGGGGLGAKTGLYFVRETEDGFHLARNDKKKSSIQGTHVTKPEGKSHALGTVHTPMILNMHTSARNPNRKNANRGGSGPLISSEKSFALETGQPHYVIREQKKDI